MRSARPPRRALTASDALTTTRADASASSRAASASAPSATAVEDAQPIEMCRRRGVPAGDRAGETSCVAAHASARRERCGRDRVARAMFSRVVVRASDAVDARARTWTRSRAVNGTPRWRRERRAVRSRVTPRATVDDGIRRGRERGRGVDGGEGGSGLSVVAGRAWRDASRASGAGGRAGTGTEVERRDDAFALIGTPGRCVTTFRVRKRTRLGQRVVLVGSSAELGRWQVLGGAAVRCAPEGDDWWSATVCLEVPVSKVVGEEVLVCEYNFAVIDDAAEATGPTYSWRSRTSALHLPSYSLMVDVMDLWESRTDEGAVLMGSTRMNPPAFKQVTQYFTGGASKTLASRDERHVTSEIWFPNDDCAIVTEDGEVVEVLENVNEAADKGVHVGDVFLATVVGKVPNMRSVLVGVEMKGGRFTKTALLRDGLSTPAAWWKGQAWDREIVEASDLVAQYDEEDMRDGAPFKSQGSDQLQRAGKYAYGVYDVGDSVLVEIIRDSRENKGAIATAEPSLTGRFTVFEGTASGTSARASKKLSVVSREFLTQWGSSTLEEIWDKRAQKLRGRFPNMRGGGAHLIMRSASVSAPMDAVKREVRQLASEWTSIVFRAAKSIEKAQARQYPIQPRLLWRDNLSFKDLILRELCSMNISSVILPSDCDPASFDETSKRISILRADTAELNTTLRTEDPNKLRQMLLRAVRFDERVPLPGTQSAQLVIQSTEALTSIDVNTGSSKRSVAEINVIAARTAAAEIRRRNISGIIVIDFVNVNPRSREQVYRQIEAEFADAALRDRGKVSFTPISPFGLMQITRSHTPYGPKTDKTKEQRKLNAASRWLARRKTR